MQRTTVMMLFGGESICHSLSLASARNVYAAIDGKKFDVITCYIDERGRWWWLNTFDSEIVLDDAEQLMPILGAGGFRGMQSSNLIRPDVILPVLHCSDGAAQGLARSLHVPIVGCELAPTAVCHDKDLTKHLLQGMGLRTVPHKSIMRYERRLSFAKLSQMLGDMLFVKPVKQGSSVGINRVTDESGLRNALDEAFRYDDHVIIEQAIDGRELEVAILGNPPTVEASDVGEIVADGFYDYDAKNEMTSSASVKVPADLPDDVREEIRMQALQVFEILNCRGLARVNFFLSKKGEIYVNGVKTMPGLKNTSMYPKLWAEAGLSYPTLIERLIKLALE